MFDLLPPGTYELIASAQGFQTLRKTGIVINAGFTANADGPQVQGPVPELGHDTAAVLTELGYTPADIADLRAQRVI